MNWPLLNIKSFRRKIPNKLSILLQCFCHFIVCAPGAILIHSFNRNKRFKCKCDTFLGMEMKLLTTYVGKNLTENITFITVTLIKTYQPSSTH